MKTFTKTFTRADLCLISSKMTFLMMLLGRTLDLTSKTFQTHCRFHGNKKHKVSYQNKRIH